MTGSHSLNRARLRYAPSVDALRSSLPDVGESLACACLELARDLTLDRLDRLIQRLNAAQTNATQLRRSLVEDHGSPEA